MDELKALVEQVANGARSRYASVAEPNSAQIEAAIQYEMGTVNIEPAFLAAVRELLAPKVSVPTPEIVS